MQPVNRTKKGIKNIVVGLGSQILVLAIGMLLPRLIMMSYGSDANGLFNSVNQIFSYLALLEAGIGTATIQSLYKPIVQSNRDEISSIMSATRRYFRKVTVLYFACIVALSILYPFIVESKFSNLEVFLVVLVMGISNVLTFWFTATYKTLITANGDSFIINNLSLLLTVLTAIAKISLVYLSANLVFIQVSHLVINIIIILIYTIIFKKKYGWVNFKADPHPTALKQRNSFVIHEFSGAVFNASPSVLLTAFTTLATVSKYSTYNMVFSALKTLTTTVHNSLTFLLGYAYNESKEKYIKLQDTYATYFGAVSFSLITVCYYMILPFVRLYTSGMEDAAFYYDEKLPFLFCLIALLSFSRSTQNVLVNISGHAKKTVPNTLIEAGINLTSSIILVQFFGIYGVLMGSIIALLYRMNDMVLYTDIKILKRSPFKSYMIIFTNFAIFGVAVFIESRLNIVFKGWLDFVIYGFLFSIIIIPSFFVINSLVHPKEFNVLFSVVKNKFKKKGKY